MESLAKVQKALLWEKGIMLKGKGKTPKLSPFPLPLFPTSLRSLITPQSSVNRHQSTVNTTSHSFLIIISCLLHPIDNSVVINAYGSFNSTKTHAFKIEF